jgi:hypothetical protein
LTRLYPDLGDPADNLASRSVLLRPDGSVYVANGRDGLLRRDAGGRWERIGLWSAVDGKFVPPHPLSPWFRTYEELAIVLLGVACALLLFALGAAQRWSPARSLGPSVSLALVAAPLATVAGLVIVWAPKIPDMVVHFALGVALVALVATGAAAIDLVRRRRVGVAPLLTVAIVGLVAGYFMQLTLQSDNFAVGLLFTPIILAVAVAAGAVIGLPAAQSARRRAEAAAVKAQ